MDQQEILVRTHDALAARRVFGDPIQADGATILPVAVVGGGGGGGVKTPQEGGVGFGLKARPAGVYFIRGDRVSWHPALDLNRVILGGQLVAIAALFTLRPLLVRWLSNRLEPNPPTRLAGSRAAG
jgi:uncharacterized spore protein YtfJ